MSASPHARPTESPSTAPAGVVSPTTKSIRRRAVAAFDARASLHRLAARHGRCDLELEVRNGRLGRAAGRDVIPAGIGSDQAPLCRVAQAQRTGRIRRGVESAVEQGDRHRDRLAGVRVSVCVRSRLDDLVGLLLQPCTRRRRPTVRHRAAARRVAADRLDAVEAWQSGIGDAVDERRRVARERRDDDLLAGACGINDCPPVPDDAGMFRTPGCTVSARSGMIKRSIGLAVLPSILTLFFAAHATETKEPGVVESYVEIVHASYRDALAAAIELQESIGRLLDDPSETTLAAARAAWLSARTPYGRTEVFRFYGGPIDVAESGVEGPELRLNAWPVDEAQLDYVRGAANSGLVYDEDVPLTRDELVFRNVRDDETYVTLGYHAIEFLLWGQDLSADGPGARPATDFAPGSVVAERRRVYLRLATEQLIDDLEYLTEAWAGGADNYATEFLALPREAALSKILTGMIRLAGFELAMERLAVPLDSGDQEDEHSCFSDNTHNDFLSNVQGLQNVYHGRYETFDGTGVEDWLAERDPELARLIDKRLDEIERAVRELRRPFDRILASPRGSKERKAAERVVRSFRLLEDLLTLARLKIDVEDES
jgi:putative iron-regulated protein